MIFTVLKLFYLLQIFFCIQYHDLLGVTFGVIFYLITVWLEHLDVKEKSKIKQNARKAAFRLHRQSGLAGR